MGNYPRMWKLRSLQVESGASGDDLLVEINQVTFATTTAATVATGFSNGQVVDVIVSQANTAGGVSATAYTCSGAVTAGTPNYITITSNITNSTDTVNVMVIGKLDI